MSPRVPDEDWVDAQLLDAVGEAPAEDEDDDVLPPAVVPVASDRPEVDDDELLSEADAVLVEAWDGPSPDPPELDPPASPDAGGGEAVFALVCCGAVLLDCVFDGEEDPAVELAGCV